MLFVMLGFVFLCTRYEFRDSERKTGANGIEI